MNQSQPLPPFLAKPNILTRVVATLGAVAVSVVAFFFGLIVLAIFAALFGVLAIVVWWRVRRTKRWLNEQADERATTQSTDHATIEGEYRVVNEDEPR